MENARLYRPLRGGQYFPLDSLFIILLVWMIPFTRIIVGTYWFAGRDCTLTVGAAPFIARMVEKCKY